MSKNLSSYLYADEAQCVDEMLGTLEWDEARSLRVQGRARELVEKVRDKKRKRGELESFLQEFGLNTEEGLALMTLAEALLRIPDAQTANALIRDKMAAADWLSKQGGGDDLMVKAAGFGLSLTRKTLDSAVSRLGEPMIRKAMVEAIRMLGRQFVLGRTIEEGVKNAASYQKKGYRLSYDMLGEGARTAKDAEHFYDVYYTAIEHIAAKAEGGLRPGMSVKLSALYPRYEFAHKERCVPVMTERLLGLAQLAAQKNIYLTVDAEEVDRLELSLEIIGAVMADESLADWDGFGLAVQAYQKRAPHVIEKLAAMAEKSGRKLQVRLVKGAYWDTEIKRAQVQGLPDYPVYTRKANTDLCYLACARALLARRDVFYPMLATHNAHTVAAILELAGNDRAGFEFQRLHGMGETLHDQILQDNLAEVSVYAPCGSHEELLPYLVRRLLENGASTSFVHQILDERVPVDKIIEDPVNDARAHETKRHTKIPLPADIYGAQRRNAAGIDFTEADMAGPLLKNMEQQADARRWEAAPLIGGQAQKKGKAYAIRNPANKEQIVGDMIAADPALVDTAFATARQGFKAWSVKPAQERAAALLKLADLLERDHEKLMGLCVREAGKTVPDALAEVREAVDFCRYYAQQGVQDFSAAGVRLPGPTGERNVLTLHGRGVFVCISPWNFPLAITAGQITAALMAGNAVIAKPAEQTPLIAAALAELMFEAGIPKDAFILMPGDGETGAALTAHPDVAGVAFTGSTEVARLINRALAAKDGPIVPLIAETGGQNAMIVDSSALPEQVIDDVLISAFGSAGQRCSALRVLYVQEDVADKVIAMLEGAMAERRIGDPMRLSSDIGPVIDDEALSVLKAHREKLDKIGRFIAAVPLDETLSGQGHFFAPVAYEIPSIHELEREVFGPVLHVIRYKADDLNRVIEDINATGYGLTLGVHSRISHVMDRITGDVQVGNAYVNRTMIGAVVGVQPFGGNGLSGTGPKAGGPHYLQRFATEKVVSVDTTRQGGNASLVTLEE
ncbi:MAG: bifunctional proline dehydrogenase/L-glutamate gamma-semialdehyde dehydrogenase PutA [Rhodospirillales bacterium]|nr:bifunctional proline dehydrogenase/L-glutamate gamma-semialdehyde dehydrogenase PutA [Rhodospirillales bacterium]MCB9996151.1 bifunctional proline dehydrogenase/L-glutamate gamma-semialdehyde dehydrogenase PutA [Rhodospirillales bacterium]